MAEEMNLGIRAGLNTRVLASVINSSTGRSYDSEEQDSIKGVSAESATENDFEKGFWSEVCKGGLYVAVGLGEMFC